MDAPHDVDAAVSRIAAAIGDPARARMLFTLLDDRARTSTELAHVAGVSPSTASAHLARLRDQRLVRVDAQGKHRYYRLDGARVARALEELSVLAGRPRHAFVPSTPDRLRGARTCYDHVAGALGVVLHDRFRSLGWLRAAADDSGYQITTKGVEGFGALGVRLDDARAARRRFAFGCLDWSERRSHLGGALGAAFLDLLLRRHWVARHRDDRALEVTALGRRELSSRLGVLT
ncbi:MAG: helix-turn-helix transcriptional regulator [Gemmatimonadota bacterium]|nr:helix-turn-helix transcriptional regulator [Gemmatimonadota bacterium]MDE3127235.1 helix-turn-helix transcriptional regulator [Gemmatimonadota bacterium]MDE3217236.1 helix-turn-helix transcriptional regulator [Gemmatimonadota bacterium]